MREFEDIPAEIRFNLQAAKKADRHNREAYRNNQAFLNGDSWEPQEAQARRNKRLMLSADLLNAPVDQVVNSVKQNPPGPAVSASGNGADKDAAEVFGGLLRRIDYENRAWIAFETAMECMTGGNFGCWEADIEYKNDRSFSRSIVVRPIPNPNETVYFDPDAIEKDRSDATWAVQLYTYAPETYRAKFPRSKLASRGPIKAVLDYFGSFSDSSLQGWATTDGIQVAKYWKVELETEKLRMYSNGIAYWDSEREFIPDGVEEDESVNPRDVEHKTIKWYITNGLEILQKGDWPGYWIPLFPVYGRERWIENKRYVTAMIQLAKQAQQAFNYAFTGACEVLASTTKAPFIGLLGQFRSKYNQWKTANTELQAFLEYDEVELKNGQTHVAPPTRNVQEPPIQAFLAFCALCVNAVQRATSVFDPSLGKQKSDQSGKAINLLQAQSSEGNFHWSAGLTIGLTHYYRAMGDLVQQEYDAPQVVEILRADGTDLSVWINKEFKAGVGSDGRDVFKHHKIATGNFAFTVKVGPTFDSQRDANKAKLGELIKVLPPQLVAQAADIFARLQDLGPLGDQLADRLVPPQYRDANDPQSAAMKLQQMTQQNQMMTQVIQKLQQAIATKQPELELKKYLGELQALATIRAAEVKAGDNEAERDAQALENMLGLAHETADAHAAREHAGQMASVNNQAQAQQAERGHQQDMEQADQQHQHDMELQENEPESEPVGGD